MIIPNKNHEKVEMSEQSTYFEKFLGLTGKTTTELDQAKVEVEERGNQLQELANQSNARFNEVMKMNLGLKEKIEFLQNLTTNLSIRNEELEKHNQELEKQKIENSKLSIDLKKNLEKVVLKEKELELQKDQLERQINEKTEELVKSQKLAIIGELASRMAHDLRNPLSTIKNVIEIMENKQKLRIEEKIIYYNKIHRAIERISHQVDDVLEYGRVTQLNLQTCHLTQLINQSILDGNFANGIKINVESSEMKINVDMRKMEAVFTNLLINASQAMDDKGTINVRILDNGANAIIAFEDSGPGTAQDVLPKIFDPLFTTKQTGTGLGLSICKKIIEHHGGSITAKNSPTTFIIRLPKNF
jgi:two-component system sensor histidine kinase HydH